MNNKTNNINNEFCLENYIDRDSSPVRALTAKMEIYSQEDVFNMLDSEFQKASNDDSLIRDEKGWHFETEFANITLVPNSDESSPYEKYMKFSFKDTKYHQLLCQMPKCDDDFCIQVPDTLNDVLLVKDNLIRLNRFITGEDADPSDEIINTLKNSYCEAVEKEKLIPYERGYNFYTNLKTQKNDDIVAGIKPVKNKDGSNSWLLNYVGYQGNLSSAAMSYALEDYADMCGEAYLEDLAALAKKEEWTFENSTARYEILKNYVAYTFGKLQLEGKICTTKDGTFSAFNTGLPSKDFEDVYMCFKKDSQDVKWKYCGVCTADQGIMWKRLVSCFYDLPHQAEYIISKDNIIYDKNKKLYVDRKHIIEHIDRIPLEFLKKYLSHIPEIAFKIEELERIEDDRGRERLYAELIEIVFNSSEAYEVLTTAITNVVNRTKNIIKWNYRLAIPSYYPKGDDMSLLLPMDFLGEGTPQAALVVQLAESGNYIGHTLLSMKQAYLNARLISSQESSWLIP